MDRMPIFITRNMEGSSSTNKIRVRAAAGVGAEIVAASPVNAWSAGRRSQQKLLA
jgi:hypothetical protein